MKKQNNTYKTFNSVIIIWTLLLSSIIPGQAKPVPADYVISEDDANQELNSNNIGTKSVYFEQNNGQFNEKVKFFARGTNGYSLFLTATEAVYMLRSPVSGVQSPKSKIGESKDLTQDSGLEAQDSAKAVAVYMKLVDANENSISSGLQEKQNRTNYFKGEKADWQTDIPNFKKVQMENVYDGIDTIWHGKEHGAVQYDFVVQPNVNPNQIEWAVEGAESVEIDEKGSLIIKTEIGTIEQAKPFTYQDNDNFRQEIESSFEMKGDNRVGVKVGEYDTSKTLTIDPTVGGQNQLEYSTYIGGINHEHLTEVNTGNNGEVYLAGSSQSVNFPVTPGSYDTSNDHDGFVSKLNSNGTDLAFSTFLGGDSIDSINDIVVNNTTGKVYITGSTADSNTDPFPTTSGAFDTTFNGGDDVYISVLGNNGSTLDYSTLLGGDGEEFGVSIAIDNSNNIYVYGRTSPAQISVNSFPTTQGAFDEVQNGADLFLTKLNLSTSSLIYSTLIGGQGSERPFGELFVDTSGNAYITGDTNSSGLFGGYPVTQGSFDTAHNGQEDAFLTKVNSSGSGLVYSTFLGGESEDIGLSLKVDSSGNCLVAGITRSTGFPTTPGAFDTTHDGLTDGFITKLNSTGSALIFSTYLGGNNFEFIYGLDVDEFNNIYVGGSTSSPNYPTTGNAYDPTYNQDDVFITKFNPNATSILYSTYFGGESDDQLFGLEIDSQNKLHFVGNTESGLPTTTGAFDTSPNGVTDGFYSRLAIPQDSFTAPYDFDGDGRTDVSIYRSDFGQWWYLRSSDGGNRAFAFGDIMDKIVPADYTGDGKTDLGVFREQGNQAEWFILRSEDSTFYSFPFGTVGDTPAPGDFDGDGKADPAVYRQNDSNWYILNSGGGTTITRFGTIDDVPVVADYDGDGKDDVAIYRTTNSQWWLNRSSDGVIVYQFGQAGDKTVQGDYTGDGKADVAFWRPSTGFWFVIRSEDQSFFGFPFGASGDDPSPGDYDGDGKFDAAIFRSNETNWYINGSTSGVQIIPFGLPTDKPVPNAYVH